ncbi:MAG: hypothetical protein GX431_08210 [Bacteroidales bacterium]|jgi:uncharacterized protein (TIGR02145 family)|nr:hypothetical protein [Bacteroidales bacterium]
MKREIRFNLTLILAILAGIAVTFSGCKRKPELATLTTANVTEITINSAKTGGNISSDGGADITARGVCYGTATLPEITGQHTSDSNGPGDFTSDLTGLTASTKYYVRAYATNEAGTAYGNEVTFTTAAPVVATLTTLEATAISSNRAVSGGNITSDGGSAVTARGVCWSTAANPTLSDNKTTNGSGTGNFASDITGLTPGTTYHVRAYATNNIGTSYGNDISFTTSAVVPTVTTAAVSSYTRTSAVTGGNVTSSGGAAVTAKGVCWSTSTGPVATGSHTTDGSGTGSFTSTITGLSPNTTYYYRAYATNSAGTAYGVENHFTTSPVTVPEVSTSSVTSVGLTTASSGGNVTNDNGAQVTERGICYNTTGNPTISDTKIPSGTGTGTFSVNLTGLTSGTVYYLKAYAINSAGTGYGSQMVFSTSISDVIGNTYATVLIGTQLWMQTDLKTSKYNDNTDIPNVTVNEEWMVLTAPAYSWFNNTPSSVFGMLYNWYAVETGKLCPSGWHVPSDNEFKTLERHLGMTIAEADGSGWRGTNQGTQLKATTTWNPNTGTNTSGFTALGGGYRYGALGTFADFGVVTYWWSSTLHWDDTTKALYRRLDSTEGRVFREGVSKAGGKYVRCLKNQ